MSDQRVTHRPPRGFSARSLKVRANQEAERVLRRVFRQWCRENGLPDPVEDYQFAKPDRKWELDLSWPDVRDELRGTPSPGGPET